MDNIWNRQFGKRKKEERIPPQAFSADGYIINQGLIRQVRYGRRTSAETGCGWIACYNFLRAMGRSEDPLEAAHEMERMLLWGGFRGSHPLSLWIFLRRRGFRFRFAFTERGTERLLKREKRETIQNERGAGQDKRETEQDERGTGQDDCRMVAGILSYKHRNGSHFAAFIGTEGDGERCRFLNVIYGQADTVWTMREFFRDRVTWPICFAMIVTGVRQP